MELEIYRAIREEDVETFNLKMSNYEDPMEALLDLIKANKMDIENIELSKLTDQYLKMMEDIENIDMEKASKFIEMAATLIEIKSKAILPKHDEETEEYIDEAALLAQRLKLYSLFKEQCEVLKPLEDVSKLYKQPEDQAHKFRIVIKDMSLDLLLDAFARIMVKASATKEEVNSPKEITKEQFTIPQKICAIKDMLISRKRVMFSELFINSLNRNEVITTFLAVLELLKAQTIKVTQSQEFGDIEILGVDKENDG